MEYDNGKMAGALLFAGGVQFLLVVTIAEALYPGYSISRNWISDLGVGPTAIIFNSSAFVLGLFVAVGAYSLHRAYSSRLLSILLILTGVGAMGAGVFPENFGIVHGMASLATFVFGGLSAIFSYKLQKSPLSYFSLVLGGMALAAVVLSVFGRYLGLGKGGMERMIVYPILLWIVGFGSHLISYSEKITKSRMRAPI